MQGKMKSFFEDTGIILVLSAVIIGGYYTYTAFTSETPNLLNTIKSKEKIVTIQEEITLDNNISIEVKDIITKKIIPIIENKEEKKILAKQETVKVSLPLIIEKVEIKKEKNVDLAMLRIFLRNIKFSMAINIVKRDDINETISQELKIRITILKDGSYEELIFVSGDKILFDMNKENILRVFPVFIDDKIKDDFPRYVRISIK